jgi:hypothetical protein
MRRLTVLVAALVAVALACSGCLWGGDTTRLTFAGTPNHVGEGAARIRPGMPVSVGGISVCLTRPGRVTIDDVSMVGPVGGIKVDGWTLLNHPEQATSRFVGTDRRSMRSYGFPLTHTVDMVCKPHLDYAYLDELVVQVERTDAHDAGFRALRIEWSSDDDRGTLDVPLAVALCNGDAGAPDCEALGLV